MNYSYSHRTLAKTDDDSTALNPSKRVWSATEEEEQTQHERPKFSSDPRSEQLTEQLIKTITNTDSINKITELCLNPKIVQMNFTIRQLGGLNNMMNLRELDLSHNEIERIDKLGSLKQLRMLRLNANRIRKIENVSILKSLEILELSHNTIDEIPSVIGLNKSLICLNLGYNCIRRRETLMSLRQCPKLQELILTGNPVASSSDYQTFITANMRQLRSLDDQVVSSTGSMYKKLLLSQPIGNKTAHTKRISDTARNDQLVGNKEASLPATIKNNRFVPICTTPPGESPRSDYRHSKRAALDKKDAGKIFYTPLAGHQQLEISQLGGERSLQGYEEYTDRSSNMNRKGDDGQRSTSNRNLRHNASHTRITINDNSLFTISDSNVDMYSNKNNEPPGAFLSQQNSRPLTDRGVYASTTTNPADTSPNSDRSPQHQQQQFQSLKRMLEIGTNKGGESGKKIQSQVSEQEKSTQHQTNGSEAKDDQQSQQQSNSRRSGESGSSAGDYPVNKNQHAGNYINYDIRMQESEEDAEKLSQGMHQLRTEWAKAALKTNEFKETLEGCKQDIEEGCDEYTSTVKEIEAIKEECLDLMKQINSWMESRIADAESNGRGPGKDSVRMVLLNERSELISKMKEFLALMDSEKEYHMNYFLLNLRSECSQSTTPTKTQKKKDIKEELSFEMIVKELNEIYMQIEILAAQILQIQGNLKTKVLSRLTESEGNEDNNVQELFSELQERFASLEERERARISLFCYLKDQYTAIEQLAQLINEQAETEDLLQVQLHNHEKKSTEFQNRPSKDNQHKETRSQVNEVTTNEKQGFTSATYENGDSNSGKLFSYKLSPRHEQSQNNNFAGQTQRTLDLPRPSISPESGFELLQGYYQPSCVSLETLNTPKSDILDLKSNLFSQNNSYYKHHFTDAPTLPLHLANHAGSLRSLQPLENNFIPQEEESVSPVWASTNQQPKSQTYSEYYDDVPEHHMSNKDNEADNGMENDHNNHELDASYIQEEREEEEQTSEQEQVDKQECNTPQLPSSLTNPPTECEKCEEKNAYINELTVALTQANKEKAALSTKAEDLQQANEDQRESFDLTLKDQAAVYQDKLRKAGHEKVLVAKHLEKLVQQSEHNTEKYLELKNKLNTAIESNFKNPSAGTHTQADLPWMLRVQADIIENLLNQRTASEAQYQETINMYKALVAGREENRSSKNTKEICIQTEPVDQSHYNRLFDGVGEEDNSDLQEGSTHLYNQRPSHDSNANKVSTSQLGSRLRMTFSNSDELRNAWPLQSHSKSSSRFDSQSQSQSAVLPQPRSSEYRHRNSISGSSDLSNGNDKDEDSSEGTDVDDSRRNNQNNSQRLAIDGLRGNEDEFKTLEKMSRGVNINRESEMSDARGVNKDCLRGQENSLKPMSKVNSNSRGLNKDGLRGLEENSRAIMKGNPNSRESELNDFRGGVNNDGFRATENNSRGISRDNFNSREPEIQSSRGKNNEGLRRYNEGLRRYNDDSRRLNEDSNNSRGSQMYSPREDGLRRVDDSYRGTNKQNFNSGELDMYSPREANKDGIRILDDSSVNINKDDYRELGRGISRVTGRNESLVMPHSEVADYNSKNSDSYIHSNAESLDYNNTNNNWQPSQQLYKNENDFAPAKYQPSQNKGTTKLQEITKSITQPRMSNIHQSLLKNGANAADTRNYHQQSANRLSFADQQLFTLADSTQTYGNRAMLNKTHDPQYDIYENPEKNAASKTLDISMSRLSAASAQSRSSSTGHKPPLFNNSEKQVSFLSHHGHNNRDSASFYSLDRALFGPKSAEKENVRNMVNDTSSNNILSSRDHNTFHDDNSSRLTHSHSSPQMLRFNRASGALPSILSNLSENLAQNTLQKTPTKPQAKLLNLHKSVINYKSFKDKLTDQSLVSKQDRSMSTSRLRNAGTPKQGTPKKLNKLLTDMNQSSDRLISPLVSQTLSAQRSSSVLQSQTLNSNRSSHRQDVASNVRVPLDQHKVFRRPSVYSKEYGRDVSVNLQSFLEHKRKMFYTPDVANYSDKFDMNSPYHPMYAVSMTDRGNSLNNSQSRLNLSNVNNRSAMK